MTQTSVPGPSSNPDQCRAFIYITDKTGNPIENAVMTATLDTMPARAGNALITEAFSAESDAAGLVYLDLYVASAIQPSKASWKISVPSIGFSKSLQFQSTTPVDLSQFIA